VRHSASVIPRLMPWPAMGWTVCAAFAVVVVIVIVIVVVVLKSPSPVRSNQTYSTPHSHFAPTSPLHEWDHQ